MQWEKLFAALSVYNIIDCIISFKHISNYWKNVSHFHYLSKIPFVLKGHAGYMSTMNAT